MLYSGFNILPRSVFWSADLNGRSDNTNVILIHMAQTANKKKFSIPRYDRWDVAILIALPVIVTFAIGAHKAPLGEALTILVAVFIAHLITSVRYSARVSQIKCPKCKQLLQRENNSQVADATMKYFCDCCNITWDSERPWPTDCDSNNSID